MSPQKAMRCVPTRPLVVKPQMKKVANRNQNTRVAAARLAAWRSVSARKLPRAAARRRAPDRRRHSASARSRPGAPAPADRPAASAAAVATDTAIATGCQPPHSASAARTGRNTSSAGCRAGRHQAHHQPAIGLEPAVDDGGAEHGGDRARAEAGKHAPGGDQLPRLGHQQAERGRPPTSAPARRAACGAARSAPSARRRTDRPARRGRCRSLRPAKSRRAASRSSPPAAASSQRARSAGRPRSAAPGR